MKDNSVWVFVGNGGTFPSGIFTDRELAVEWIIRERLTGVLTEYPLDIGTFEWATANGHYVPKPSKVIDALFIGRFTSGAQRHEHYDEGEDAGKVALRRAFPEAG